MRVVKYNGIYICFLSLIFTLIWSKLHAQAPEFSHNPGFYTDDIELTINCPSNFSNAWVTNDGTSPGPDNPHSFLASSAIQLDSREGVPNGISMIPLNEVELDGYQWMPPQSEIYKAHALLVSCFNDNGSSGETFGGTFFIDNAGSGRYSLPVISIITDPHGLFDFEDGIMVPGIHFDGNLMTGNYHQRGRDWEREVHIEFFEPDGEIGFAHFAGVRIHGNFSRMFPLKSLRLYSRSDYGTSRFEYPLFPQQPSQRFNRFILRNSGNDFAATYFRDAITHQFYRSTGTEVQDFQPVIKFINGEYWGIYNLRERYDRHYFNRNYDIDRDNLDYLDIYHNREPQVSDGSRTFYMAMLDYALENDLSEQEHYEHILTMMDIDSFINQTVLNVFVSNTDWPQTNVRMFRTRNEYSPEAGIKDGRFRWLINDIDNGFGIFEIPHYHNNLDRIFSNEWHNELFLSLIVNDNFRSNFINRFADHMHTVLSEGHTFALIEHASEKIESEIQEHMYRWNYPADYQEWMAEVNTMKEFIELRSEVIYEQLLERFDIAETVEITLNTNNTSGGYIQLNSIKINEFTAGLTSPVYPFTGRYFSGVPVTVKAIATAGYEFAGWDGYDSNLPEITINPAEVSELTAIFEPSVFEPDDINPIAHSLFENGSYEFSYWSPDEPEGSFPPSMVFLQSDRDDPNIQDDLSESYNIPEDEYHEDDSDNIGFPYNLTRRTRINALGSDGISFINTGRDRDLGAALLALDTRNIDAAYIHFRAGTVSPNNRLYGIRLLGRRGNNQPFMEILNENGGIVEYVRNELAGHSTYFSNIPLPDYLLGHSYVQLKWKYHHIDIFSGPRAELSLGDMKITTEKIVSVEQIEKPANWKLYPNYPNPFNPETTIRFEIPEASYVLLEVYDALGRRVAQLVNDSLSAGMHHYSFNAGNLASGLYFYRLRSINHSINLTGKMLLVK